MNLLGLIICISYIAAYRGWLVHSTTWWPCDYFSNIYKVVKIKTGIQPTQTNETLKESIDSVKNNLITSENYDYHYEGNTDGEEGGWWQITIDNNYHRTVNFFVLLQCLACPICFVYKFSYGYFKISK